MNELVLIGYMGGFSFIASLVFIWHLFKFHTTKR